MKLNYCTECAAPLRKESDTKYECDNGHPYYNNPRAACCVVLINDKQELLYAKRAHEPAKGKYDFPGGFLDYGEDGYQAIIREAKEEMGIELSAEDIELVDCSANSYIENITTCDFVFICRRWHGEPLPADDVEALEWKPLDFLNSSEFAWSYPHLSDKLQTKLQP